MENQPTKLKKAVNISIFIPVIILSAFVLSGCSKNEQTNQLKENLSAQQAQIDELQKSNDAQKIKIDEQQAKIDALETSRDSQIDSESKQVTTRSVADEVYCQTNAKSYSQTAYDIRKESTEGVRDDCIEKDSDACDKAVSKAKKLFEEFKVQYNNYHSKCD